MCSPSAYLLEKARQEPGEIHPDSLEKNSQKRLQELCKRLDSSGKATNLIEKNLSPKWSKEKLKAQARVKLGEEKKENDFRTLNQATLLDLMRKQMGHKLVTENLSGKGEIGEDLERFLLERTRREKPALETDTVDPKPLKGLFDAYRYEEDLKGPFPAT